MIRYFYDTEFLETGTSIDLISIGIVTEDGSREYYAVNRNMPVDRIRKNPWLVENVWPHLPHPAGASERPEHRKLDLGSTLVREHRTIANEVRDFLLEPNEPMQLWAYYGAYDHVVVSWLWGRMIDRPNGIPMFSFDVMQFAASLGMDDANLPQQTGQLHNALDDARWTRDAWRYLTGAAERMAGRES